VQYAGNSSNRTKFRFCLVGAAHYNLIVSVLEVIGCVVVASILMEEAAILFKIEALRWRLQGCNAPKRWRRRPYLCEEMLMDVSEGTKPR
jgi:hypothetical protein